jgi:hypothetical protein
MRAAITHLLRSKAALLFSTVAIVGAFAGATSGSADAATFHLGCSPAPCIGHSVNVHMNIQCQTTHNPNGTKTRRIVGWITYSGLTPDLALDTTIALANSAGYNGTFGPWRLGYGQTFSLGASTVAGNAPAINVRAGAVFRLWKNGRSYIAPGEVAAHSSYWNGLPVTHGAMNYCQLF